LVPEARRLLRQAGNLIRAGEWVHLAWDQYVLDGRLPYGPPKNEIPTMGEHQPLKSGEPPHSEDDDH
jgi:hypothetical protein